jgi:Type IV secretory pathway, VirB11 components, and related ATPases involved in archaeal flagella biosynthesis
MLKALSLKKIFSSSNPRHEDFFTRLVHDYQENTFFQEIKASRVLEEYLVGGVVKVRIVEGEDGLYYVVEEPGLAPGEAEVLGRILGIGVECETLECISSMLDGDGGSNGLASRLYYHYMKITTGYGPLYPILLDPLVEEISLNSSDKRVWVIHRAFNQLGWIKTNMMVGENLVDRLVLSFSRKIRKHVSIASPIAEGLTGEGYRVSLIFGSNVSRKGSSIVVRKKPEKPWTITQLINSGVLNSLITAYLWLVLELKGWIIIAGGVGAGKTTLLQGLLNLVPFNKRVITIEDTPELYLPSDQWDPLVESVLSLDSGQSIDM